MLIGVGLAAAKYLNGAEVLDALRSFNYLYAPFVLLLAAVYLGLKSWRFVLLMRPLSTVAAGPIFRGYAAGQAATLVPGGVAARAGLMRQLGIPVAVSSAPVLFSSLLDQVVFIGCSIIAALWFEAARTPALILVGVLAVLALVFIVPASRRGLARGAGWLAERFKVRAGWQNFLVAVNELATWRVMGSTLAVTVFAFALKVITLDLCLRGVGAALPYPTLFLAYILPTMLGRLSALPAGGIGVTEAGMVGFLASTSNLDPDTATAAVALFRIATVLFEALLGALVYSFAWRGEAEPQAQPLSADDVPAQGRRAESR
ncbi:hypothetical protein BH24DEI2_BH24DEI2_01560 [soil metagenome]